MNGPSLERTVQTSKPMNFKILECKTRDSNFSKILPLKERDNSLIIKLKTTGAATIWLGHKFGNGTCIFLDDEEYSMQESRLSAKTSHDFISISQEDEKLNSITGQARMIIEWSNTESNSEIQVRGFNKKGNNFEDNSYQLPHRIESLSVGTTFPGQWNIFRADKNAMWVPSAWGLLPSTAVAFDSIHIARSLHKYLNEDHIIPGILQNNQPLEVLFGSEKHEKVIYEVLCNINTEWICHKPGGVLHEQAIEVGNVKENEKYIGRVHDEETYYGKVEYRWDDSNDYVCYYNDGQSKLTSSFEYLIRSFRQGHKSKY